MEIEFYRKIKDDVTTPKASHVRLSLSFLFKKLVGWEEESGNNLKDEWEGNRAQECVAPTLYSPVCLYPVAESEHF